MKLFIIFSVLLSFPLQSIAMSDYLTVQCPHFSNEGLRLKTIQLSAGKLGLGAVATQAVKTLGSNQWSNFAPLVKHAEQACILESTNFRVEVICERDSSARAIFDAMKLIPFRLPNGQNSFLVWGMPHSDSTLVPMGHVISALDGKCILRAGR